MKNMKPTAGFLKQIISVITAMAKSKTLALKSKTRAIKTRLIIFSLLQRNKKIMLSSISDKLRTLIGHHEDHHHLKKDDDEEEDDDDDDDDEEMGNDQNSNKQAIVVHNAMSIHESVPNPTHTEVVDDTDNDSGSEKYPDLSHSLFELDDDEDPGGSVIDLVKNSKPEGEEFRLEDEINQVADLFIKRFHRQMRIQKQLSFKRYHEMIDRSA